MESVALITLPSSGLAVVASSLSMNERPPLDMMLMNKFNTAYDLD